MIPIPMFTSRQYSRDNQMKLSGIENEREFFPPETLAEVLKYEIDDLVSRWSGLEETVHPVARLRAVSASFIEMLGKVRNIQDMAERTEMVRKMHYLLLQSLGYVLKREEISTALHNAPEIPVVCRMTNADGEAGLWILDVPFSNIGDETADPLEACYSPEQFSEDVRESAACNQTIETILTKGVFELSDAPRHVLILGLSEIILIDRNKWPAQSAIRFDLQEIFTRADKDTLTIMACLASREGLVPSQGISIADRMKEETQRHANAVTASLKQTVRDAIEILGQEVLDVNGGKYKGIWIDGQELSHECLRYMYRLLFLFYAEANPKLNLLDMKNPVYSSGYSLEMLRELENTPLHTNSDRNGTFFWESLQRTLNLFYIGLDIADEKNGTGLRLPQVKMSLLDPKNTEILNQSMLRNEVVQEVIKLLSLRSGKRNTGRISYAKLGIGQLGAVYETLISFTGVVAKTDLIELKSSSKSSDVHEERGVVSESDEQSEDLDIDEQEEETGINRNDTVDKMAASWFVPRSRRKEFDPERIVFDGGRARVYKKGTFMYRLAGRDREKSASYYTPEPLARLLVKHVLMERCKGLAADEILDLKILEPAMGSGAFLVETVNQLADLYIVRKQKETGRKIPLDRVLLETQKIRAYMADRNCFGVDLNPVAAELGSISLWLNSIHGNGFSPWFGTQFHSGNSLVGARRAIYDPKHLTAKKQSDLWYNMKPEEIGWKRDLPDEYVWQWLLPAKGMAAFDTDKSIAPFARTAQDKIRAWRRGGFFKKLETHEIKLVQKLSKTAEVLFDQVIKSLEDTRNATNDRITLWPDRDISGNEEFDYRDKERLNAHLTGIDHVPNTLAYKRLKTAMDAWCALWFWPLDRTDLLPERAEFLHTMAVILEGGFAADGSLIASSLEEFSSPAPDFLNIMEPDEPEHDMSSEMSGQQDVLFGETNVEALIDAFPWLQVVEEVAEREQFVHFDLIFADVMKTRGGFDIIVGNPPWARPGWNESIVLADIDPLFAGLSAADARRVLPEALLKASTVQRDGRMVSAERAFLRDFVSTRGAMKVTSSEMMNPFAGGGANNLYRCFIDLSFRLVGPQGYAALIHQDGHLVDPKAGKFRQHWYTRVAKYFRFSNRITAKSFAEVHSELNFSLNIYKGQTRNVDFEMFTHAFLPSQIDDSYADRDGFGEVPGIRGQDGKWDTRGHRDRIMRIDHDALSVIHALSEGKTVPIDETRFIQPYSTRTLDVFRQIAHFPKLDAVIPKIMRTISTATEKRTTEISLWQMGHDWNETTDQHNGNIQNETAFRPTDQMILQGPLFHVGNPLYKTPKAISRTNADYLVIDLTTAPDDYLPRTNFGPALDMEDYRSRLTPCRWNPTKSHADFYRVAFRNMIALNGERSLIGAMIPPGTAHIHTVESIACANEIDTLTIHLFACSIPFDYLLKANGRDHLFGSDIARWPFPKLEKAALHRALRLACLTIAYADLWNRHASTINVLPWSSSDPRLQLEGTVEGPITWDRTAGLRTEFARRMALVEIDVLVAQALSLTLDQLIEIYRIYFPVLQENEAGTWYDQNGRIVWTCSMGLPGVGWLDENGKSPGRSAWEKIMKAPPSELTCTAIDDTMPSGPRDVIRHFVGPFTRCDRIEDYKRTWTHFEKLKSEKVN